MKRKYTIKDIDRLFRNIIFRRETKGHEGYAGGQMAINDQVGVSGFYLHGRKSKIVLWDSKSGESIATIDYSIRKERDPK